ncbi:MAG TPA: MFS transporter [Clostridia bacterium]|nr:MFS transporter [Clostridia bacterium]
MKKNYTLSFSLYQAFFAFILLPFFAYGTYYLIHLGLSSVSIGILLALVSALSVLLQSPLASLADNDVFTIDGLISICLGLYVFSNLGLALGYFPLVFFTLAFVCLNLINPLFNALNIEWNQRGHRVDFGISKGVSSLSYAFFSFVLGRLLLLASPLILPLTAALGGGTLLILILKNKPVHRRKKKRKEKKDRISILKNNPNLVGVLLGICLVYANYAMYNSYLINTIQALGGKESALGGAIAIAAMAEIPVMIFFTQIMRRFELRKLLVFATFFFTLKSLFAYLATGMPMLYFSQFLQMFSFGLYLPTSVYYMASITSEDNRAEAQTALAGATILGRLFSSVLGGALIEYLGVSAMLLAATLMSASGTAFVYIFTRRISHEEK